MAQDGGTPPRSSTCTAFITVLDENDNAPSFTYAQTGRELLLQVSEQISTSKSLPKNAYSRHDDLQVVVSNFQRQLSRSKTGDLRFDPMGI